MYWYYAVSMLAGSDRAPRRGRYDRRLSAAARMTEQRARLLRATGVAAANGNLNVSAVVAIAGVSRATFYEFFDDAEHARASAEEWIGLEIARALDVAKSSRWDVLREICAVWLD